MALVENNRYIVQVFVGALSQQYEALSVEASKQTTSEEIVTCIAERLELIDNSGSCGNYELAEVVGDSTEQECKERRLGATECPVALMLLWPKTQQESYRFYLREKLVWSDDFAMDPQLIKDYFYRFLYQPKDREYPDLCQLPDLNEQTLLDNLRARFMAGHIYTYVGSILIAVNPFKFHPIYNPKYVKLYQNTRLCPNLPPHIFAVADTAYHCMLKERRNQCIVISGESGSGKTESTNFLLHHLTALSQKGSHGSGVEQTILSAGPVLEAFGNAKTAHNNNSSRFGKFIQVNYKENGMVHGAVVQKYLLEKSRICSQGRNERNYHVFYYLLAGASEQERQILHLKTVDQYHYLSRSGCYQLDNVDEKHEFSRLKQSMEMVGFTAEKQRRLFSVLSAVLLLGNVEFQPRKSAYHHDEAVAVKNPEVVSLISQLLRVKQETLLAALTAKRARASGETLVISYRLPEAMAARDAMAKCLYGALFDWIVLQVNHALLSKKDTLRDHQGNSIGVLDIFGFEDFELCNSFEQLCINYANEHLQYYFNQHVFKYEQEEYRKEGIRWTNIEFMDNTGCLQLIEGKPNGLLCVLDDQCNFPGATNETLLQKFNTVHKDNIFYEKPQKREGAFMVRHYAGKVKYQAAEMREKNLDLMRQDIVGVLKNSSMAFVRELVGADPVAVFRWAIVRAFFRGYFAFQEAGRKHRQLRTDHPQHRYRNHIPNENLIRKNKSFRPRERGKKGLKNLQTVKTLAGRTGITASNQAQLSKARKQPLTVTAQFQQSLHSLMDTLNQANPFFIRCIKSNSNKIPNRFDDETVQRQLRYTGMLETVRIRQAGFNVRLTYDEFIQLYRILLPKGLLSSQQDVRHFLATLNLNRDNYQLGASKIFLRESEKIKLDFKLHQQIMASIISIQRWFRSCLERKRFLRLRNAAITIQSSWKIYTAQRKLNELRICACVLVIQSAWRGYKVRRWYHKLKRGLCKFQAHARGVLARRMFSNMKLHQSQSSNQKLQIDQRSSGVSSSNETILSFCPEEVEKRIRDSDESSGIQEDGDMDPNNSRSSLNLRPTLSLPSVTPTYPPQSLLISPQLPPSHRVDTVREGTLLDVNSYPKRRLSKTYQSVDLSDLSTYTPRKSSIESMNSQKTDEFSSSQGVRESIEKTRQRLQIIIDSTRKNIERSVDGPYYDADGTYTASPAIITNTLPRRPNEVVSAENVWRVRSDHEKSPTKTVLNRSALVTPQKSSSQDSSFTSTYSRQELSPKSSSKEFKSETTPKREIRTLADGLISCPPIRRNTRTFSVDPASQYKRNNETTSNRIRINLQEQENKPPADDKNLPEVPARSIRKPRRDVVCRSVGEEVTDSSLPVEAKNTALLGTIGETNILAYETSPTRPDWNQNRKEIISTDSTRLIQHESGEWTQQQFQTPGGKRPRSGGIPSLELRRRNSDPATKISGDPSNPAKLTPGDYIEWKTPTLFTIAGHRFVLDLKVVRFSKDDRCGYCGEEMDALVTQGFKCVDCKQLFHTTCIQNCGVVEMPCLMQNAADGGIGKPGRRKHRKHSRTPYDITKQAVTSKFSLTGTSEFTDSTDKIISDARELQSMQDFITKKIYKMESQEGQKPSEVDRVFKQALREFKDNLVATYSVMNKQGYETLNIKYKDLIANFLHVMETVCVQEQKGEDFPVTMGVNAFRGFLNEFMSTRNEPEKPGKAKRKKEKKRKVEDQITFAGHSFLLTIFNIPMACEICTSFFMWPIERGLVCQTCKLICHKKCYTKVTGCTKETSSQNHGSPRIFGVPLNQLVSGDSKVPPVVDRLITTIEMYGMYTEGIYRKSGVSSKVKELKMRMEEANQEGVNFENYQVHVLASVLKSFLREMPEPLLTFDCYEDFIRAANLTDPQDRVSTLFAILKKLPKANFDLMERLIFHLARVASHEDANRMNAASLAIVFAPCILRTNKKLPAQDSLQDIGRQTQCIETIISEQLRKVKATLADIDTLDTACHTATHRLSSLRSSKVFSPEELLPQNQNMGAAGASSSQQTEGDDEEALLVGHIKEIKKEKEILTSTLPSLTRTTSDDDLLSTDLDGDGEGSMDDISCGTPSADANPDRCSVIEQRGRRIRGPVIRSVSGGDATTRQPPGVVGHQTQLKRQSSSDIGLLQKAVEECDDAPIMV
ncbi:unconventional myosin-IXa-like [Chrysoperla carnea]|uniref:unconventional myosin-IXa-like n=1 Tax=Chrysoperla carnea TaxID=189513 RepID=UPI001D0804F0|nr:unconventional myosin-IXa-like [Chrysoperla carnea]